MNKDKNPQKKRVSAGWACPAMLLLCLGWVGQAGAQQPKSFADGLAAFEQGDWYRAVQEFRKPKLQRNFHPDDAANAVIRHLWEHEAWLAAGAIDSALVHARTLAADSTHRKLGLLLQACAEVEWTLLTISPQKMHAAEAYLAQAAKLPSGQYGNSALVDSLNFALRAKYEGARMMLALFQSHSEEGFSDYAYALAEEIIQRFGVNHPVLVDLQITLAGGFIVAKKPAEFPLRSLNKAKDLAFLLYGQDNPRTLLAMRRMALLAVVADAPGEAELLLDHIGARLELLADPSAFYLQMATVHKVMNKEGDRPEKNKLVLTYYDQIRTLPATPANGLVWIFAVYNSIESLERTLSKVEFSKALRNQWTVIQTRRCPKNPAGCLAVFPLLRGIVAGQAALPAAERDLPYLKQVCDWAMQLPPNMQPGAANSVEHAGELFREAGDTATAERYSAFAQEFMAIRWSFDFRACMFGFSE